MRFLQLSLILVAWLAIAPWTQVVDARPYYGFGVRIYPGYYGPGPFYPYGYGYPYGYAYPYFAPAPVVIQPAPIVVGLPPAPVPRPVAPVPPPARPFVAPVPAQAPAQPPFGSEPLPTPTVTAVPPALLPVRNDPPTRMDTLLRQLSDPSETVRRDAALDLGRMQAQRAIDPLANVLTKDPSPLARDGAARGLGLIGSQRSLNALIYAAQADNDREVRHSAQFAVETIRASLRGN